MYLCTIKNFLQIGTIYGVMRLTVEGTQYYGSLDSAEKHRFFTDLKTEISEIVPVSDELLSSSLRTQVDSSIKPNLQILISFNIQSSKNDRNPAAIVDDLNTMIRYKDVSPIGLKPTARYLDSEFGYIPSRKYFNE